MDRIFSRADILLPRNCDMTKWSVVACDQFSAQPDYWAAREQEIGSAPSTLHLMLPEAYLDSRDQLAEAARINSEMERYLQEGIFRELKDSFVYLERTLNNGTIRRGLLGVLDLEAYDYSAASVSPIRATEGTIESRLPPRVQVREGAPLEMPHIMVFIDDTKDIVIGPLAEKDGELPLLYDFDLCAGGGHIRGWQVTGKTAESVDSAVADLVAASQCRNDTEEAPVIFAMGDGNHSLATAKKCWQDLVKPKLSAAERRTHPARYALVELVNIHDPAITFEPIHRVLFSINPAVFIQEARKAFLKGDTAGEKHYPVRLVTSKEDMLLHVPAISIGRLIGTAERFCHDYIVSHGGKLDYIHNDDTALELGRQPDQAAILLPILEKTELFTSVAHSGAFPKKSFSIGLAQDKRYYLECRKIR